MKEEQLEQNQKSANADTYYLTTDNSGFISADYLSSNLIAEDGIIITSEERNTSADLNR